MLGSWEKINETRSLTLWNFYNQEDKIINIKLTLVLIFRYKLKIMTSIGQRVNTGHEFNRENTGYESFAGFLRIVSVDFGCDLSHVPTLS